jgi:hypothetical protein
LKRYDEISMRPPNPPPSVPGATDAERMDNAVRKLFSVSKDAYLKEEGRLKRARERKKRAAPKQEAPPHPAFIKFLNNLNRNAGKH